MGTVNGECMAGRMINGTAALAGLVRPASDTDEAGVHRVLPVAPELSGLLPSRGLRRGSTVAVASPGLTEVTSSRVAMPGGGGAAPGLMASGGGAAPGLTASGDGAAPGLMALGGSAAPGLTAPGSGGTSLLLALLSAASQAGSWCAVVGVPALGALAAAESGIALDRLALVPNPGPDWPTVVAALIDGVDVVVAAVPGQVSASITSRLVARARQRGSVLVSLGPWAGADVTLQIVHGVWEGLGTGHGRLRRRQVIVTSRGRGAAARPREITLWLPGTTAVPPIDPPPAATNPDHDPAGDARTTPVVPGAAVTRIRAPGSDIGPAARSGVAAAGDTGPAACGGVAVASDIGLAARNGGVAVAGETRDPGRSDSAVVAGVFGRGSAGAAPSRRRRTGRTAVS